MADSKLRIILETIAKGVGAKATAKGLKGVEEAAKKAGQRLGKDLVGAAKLGVAGLVGIGVASIKLATDAEEMQSKFDTVFKTVGGDVTKALDDFSKAAGRNRFELRGMAAELGDIFKPLGFAEKEAGDLSVQMVKLAADLGSFNNMPMDEALARLRGTLVGSHENALAFGVVINESTIKAELAAKGWDKLTGAALNQAKVQIRLNLLLAGSSDAMGDSVRTADSMANQMQRLKANAEEAGVAIGQQLVPAALRLVEGLNTLLSAGQKTNEELIEMSRSADLFEAAAAASELNRTAVQRLEKAYIDNRLEMLNMVKAGQLTVDQFNEYSKATFEAAQEGGAFVKTAEQMAEQGELQFDVWGVVVEKSDELSSGYVTLTASMIDALAAGENALENDLLLLDSRQRLKDEIAAVTAANIAIIPTEAELAEAEKVAAAAAKEQAAANREVAESLEAARQRAADTSIEFNNLAQSLVNATQADLAKVALDNLNESLDIGVISGPEHAAATREVMLAFGLATDESLRMADSMGNVNQLFIDGKIDGDQLVEVIGTLEETGGDLDQALGLLDITLGGVSETTNEAELSNLALITTQQDMSESVADNSIHWGILKDRMFEANKITDETRLSAEALRSPVVSAGEAAKQAAADFKAWAAAMVESNSIAKSLGSGVPLPSTTPVSVPAFQHGGTLGRFGIVGDAGPELIAGNRVFDNSDTREIIGVLEAILAASRGGGNTFNVTTSAQPDVGQMVSQAQALAGAQ